MAKKATPQKLTNAEQLSKYMEAVDQSLKKEVEVLRKIIKGSSTMLKERIKWNAPSYYTTEDIVTFGPLRKGKILLVFHHPFVVKIKSALLEGDYKDRRLAYFSNMKEIKTNKDEVQRIIMEIVAAIDSKS